MNLWDIPFGRNIRNRYSLRSMSGISHFSSLQKGNKMIDPEELDPEKRIHISKIDGKTIFTFVDMQIYWEAIARHAANSKKITPITKGKNANRTRKKTTRKTTRKTDSNPEMRSQSIRRNY
jgi:hypothetical protein